MNAHDRFDANVRNLTNLWSAMGATPMGDALHASQSWPDRLWLGVDVQPERSDVMRWIQADRGDARSMVLPVWCRSELGRAQPANMIEGLDLEEQLHSAGYSVSFEQTVMSMDLANWRADAAANNGVELVRVVDEAAGWAEVASRSFGYTVDPGVAEALVEAPGVGMLMARKAGAWVGTGLAFATGDSIGLHMVGVLPEARRKGIARKIMVAMLNEARTQGFAQGMLQASDMGEGLYRQLGFSAFGRIKNYRRA